LNYSGLTLIYDKLRINLKVLNVKLQNLNTRL